tara:strand:+ start:11037 stop:12581 length:1545 start_codon:yes stop_codon:yes gene_type:complete
MNSVAYHNGYKTIEVKDIKFLLNPSQDLANSMATGPQDELYTALDRFNSRLPEGQQLTVTPSWNWKPGTIPKFKEYLINNLLKINTKSNGLYHLMKRTRIEARYHSYLESSLQSIENKKAWLKHENYSANVDIVEFTQKLKDMVNRITEQCESVRKMTNGNVTINVVLGNIDNPRNTVMYVDVYMQNLVMNIFQKDTCVQLINLSPIRIVSSINMRKFINLNDKKQTVAVSRKGLYMSEQIPVKGIISRYGTHKAHANEFPFIATPYLERTESNSVHNINYGAVCLDNFTDEVNKSFFSLNWVDMAISLMSWAQYYNSEYSNPYNGLSLLHLGMPKGYSAEYQAISNRRENCESTMTDLHSTKWQPHTIDEVEGLESMHNHCQSIGCQWAGTCETYKKQAIIANNLQDLEIQAVAEGFMGLMISYDTPQIRHRFVDSFGYIKDGFDMPAEEYYADLVMVVRMFSIREMTDRFSLILPEMLKVHEDGGELADRDGEAHVGQDMEEQMIRWATERG